MKRYSFFILLLMCLTASVASAQYDDIYYDPDRDAEEYNTTRRSNSSSNDNRSTYSRNDRDDRDSYDDAQYDNRRNNDNYDSEYYEYDDEYDDYLYSSRIQRFHRPYRGFGYYDVAYVDWSYYDPFYYDRWFNRPGVSISFGNPYWNRWNRVNRWNNWGWFDRWNNDWAFNSWNNSRWNSWGWNDPWGWNNCPTAFGWNNWGWGGNNVFINNYYGRANFPFHTGHWTTRQNGGFNVNPNQNNNVRFATYAPRGSSTLNRDAATPNSGRGTFRNTPRSAERGELRAPAPQNNQPATVDPNTNRRMPRNTEGSVRTQPDRSNLDSDAPRVRDVTPRPTPQYERPQRSVERNDVNRDQQRVTPREERMNEQPRERPNRDIITPREEERRSERNVEQRRQNYEERRQERQERPSRSYDNSQPRQERQERQESRQAPQQRQESRSYEQRSSPSPSPSNNNNSGGGGSRRGGRGE